MIRKNLFIPSTLCLTMEGGALYGTIARYYDLIYHDKDYEKDSKKLIVLIHENLRNGGRDLLDLGCGTGNHLAYMSRHFNCTGMDINDEMLKVAKEKSQNVKLVQGDMTDFHHNKKYDIILSMFGTIGYCKDLSTLERTFKNVFDHLRSGGVFIFEPWLDPASFTEGIPFLNYYDGEDIKVARVTSSKRKGSISEIEMHYLVSRKGHKVEHYYDIHELGLFEIPETKMILTKIGFTVKYDEEGLGGHQGIFIALKE
jgi:SAM-dependent methyltransferase